MKNQKYLIRLLNNQKNVLNYIVIETKELRRKQQKKPYKISSLISKNS